VPRRLGLVLAVSLAVVVAGAVVQRVRQQSRYQRLMTEGETARSMGQPYAAVEAFSGAIALRPGAMPAYYWRGEAYRDLRQDDRAISDLREAARLAPSSAQPLVALGQLFDHRGDAAEAAEWYSLAAARLRDADPTLLYSLSLALYRSGSPAAALDPLKRALARDPSLAEAHYLIGLVYRDAQNAEAAAISLQQAIRLAPSLLAAREELADLYREAGRTQDEREQLEILAAIDPGVQRALALALMHIRDDRLEEALAVLAEAAPDTPSDSRVDLATGRALIARAEHTGDRGAARRALTALESALGGTAARSEGLALFGRALYLSGDPIGAERSLKEAVATSPIDREAYTFLADAAEAASHPDVAREALLDLDVLEGDAAKPATRAARARRVGTLSLALHDGRLALTSLQQARDAGWSDPDTFALLAQAQAMAGDVDAAGRTLNEAIALHPTNTALRRLRRTLEKPVRRD
jgi:tetratricopeptide (TPR) repeat protein